MWGHIWTESSNQFNFNTGFSSLQSDILIHLSQWQYWWWFWFSLVWVFYFFLILRVTKYRLLKMKPKISTSFRPHGKWGDFLVCLIPLIWCINILTNSNLILRMIEWQNESSLFTVRIRAKQWYWIYKFELKNFTDILSTPKNIGYNKWHINTFGDLQTADNYLHILQLRSQNKAVKDYWDKILIKSKMPKKTKIISPQEQIRLDLFYKYKYFKKSDIFINKMPQINRKINKINNLFNFNFNLNKNYYYYLNNNYYSIVFTKKNSWKLNKKKYFNQYFQITGDFSFKNKIIFNNNKLILNNILRNLYKTYLYCFDKNKNNSYIYNIIQENFDDYSKKLKKNNNNVSPIRLIKSFLNLESINNIDSSKNLNLLLYKIRFNDTQTSDTYNFNFLEETNYLIIKQKRYKRKKNIPIKTKYVKDIYGKIIKDKLKYTGQPYLVKNEKIILNVNDPMMQYNFIKKNKNRGELIPISLSKRLLRTKKILTIPSHTNITLITNSYDIIHSWFIPSLGLKLDCVPGRSTHHTIYIDNSGFYYGQCAEICGRYHHHMPIRICALPFEQFLLWWNVFGLPKMLNTISKNRFENKYVLRKYTW